jgi:hypothetical protein
MDLGSGIQIGPYGLCGVGVKIDRNLAFGIIQIAKNSGSPGTGGYTGRFHAFGDAVVAKITLVSRIGDGVKEPRSIGTGIDANMTADTNITVHMHYAVLLGAVGGPGGTEVQARGILAIVAKPWKKMKSHIWIGSLGDLLHPGAVFSVRDVILTVAGYGAPVTTGTAVGINDHAVLFTLRSLGLGYPLRLEENGAGTDYGGRSSSAEFTEKLPPADLLRGFLHEFTSILFFLSVVLPQNPLFRFPIHIAPARLVCRSDPPGS